MQVHDCIWAALHALVLPYNIMTYWQWRLLRAIRVLNTTNQGASIYAATLSLNIAIAAGIYSSSEMRHEVSADVPAMLGVAFASILAVLLYAYMLQSEYGSLHWLHPLAFMDSAARVAVGWAGGFPADLPQPAETVSEGTSEGACVKS